MHGLSIGNRMNQLRRSVWFCHTYSSLGGNTRIKLNQSYDPLTKKPA